jgi:beta-galactosidase GanA
LPRLSAISFGERVVLSNPIVASPARGMMRLWTLDAHAHGAEVVSYFRWRQAPFAQEQIPLIGASGVATRDFSVWLS